MVSKKRAKSGADKLERRIQILDSALELWKETGYESLTMSQIAERTGLAKGTLYLYFNTKEELFLAIYIQLMDEFFDVADSEIVQLRKAKPSVIAGILIDLILERPNLQRILPLVPGTLEKNIGEEAGRQYKGWSLRRVGQLGEAIENAMNGLPPGTGNDSLIYLLALITGLQPMSEPSAVLEPIVEDPSYIALKVEFGPALKYGFETLLTGFQRLAN